MSRLVRSALVASPCAAVLLTLASPAAAHVALVEPPARYDSNVYIKDYPCGHPDNPDGAVTRTYEEGSTITVTWDEYIGHPGHFRIALSAEGDAALVDPTDYDDFYVAANVLLDDIPDPDGVSDHSVEITLPAGVTCEKCTLQLLQIMTDKMPWGPAGGNELYYQCADITITPAGAVGDTGAGTTSGAGEDTGVGEDSTDGGSVETTADSVTSATTEEGGAEATGVPPVGTTDDGLGSDDDDGGGCGCRTDGGGTAPVGLVVLLAGLVRRRRRAA